MAEFKPGISAASLIFDEQGLIPAIVQDFETKQILMLGYMNKESIDATLKTNLVTFWSRSRNQIWEKGETSGNWLELVSIAVDCDRDALLLQVKPAGPTCHTGEESCFSVSDNE